eukprot:4927178-Pleurochrysis_carterae.AAC.1
MFELVAQRGQVGDVGGDLTDDVAKPLVQVGCQAFVAFLSASTQRTAGHAQAEKEEGEIRAGRAPNLEGRRHAVAGDDSDEAPGTCGTRSPWETGGRRKRRQSPRVAGSLEGDLRGQNQPTRTTKETDSRKKDNEDSNESQQLWKNAKELELQSKPQSGRGGVSPAALKNTCSRTGPQMGQRGPSGSGTKWDQNGKLDQKKGVGRP